MSTIISSEQSLKKVLAENKDAFVLFYASWCPYCVRFLPVFEKQAGDKPHFFRAMTDAMAACEDTYAIDIVPTVLYFKNGEVARRLDGVPGQGLTEQQLAAMIDSCGLG